jgi:hypothetical protein
MLVVSSAHAAVDRVTTFKDENGWKLQKNGEDFYVKGVVWGYSPRGQNYTYNLWGESDEFIRKVLDHDFGLMAKAGVTANRSFAVIPPEWVTYIYEKHGIMSLINPLMGRYGANIGGVWRPNTNYQDELTRKTLKADVLAVVEQYKDVKGVLMFAFGNESNYGLSWSSFDIEDLPVGEQNREKAKFLYSLWGEVIREGKQIAPDHLFTIVNGDIQYLDLIAEYVQDMDVLGTNVYRGISFGDLWKDVKADFDRPIVFMEFGSDAFNAKNFAEDQPAQASFLRGQWQEMYNQSYGNGGYGNAIGGFVFEWRDEWWKSPPSEERLDTHDRTATWGNGGYTFDFVEGQNNMNEEWFGIMALGDIDDDGIYVAEPRMAYDVLTEIWSMDPYSGGKAQVDAMIRDVDMELLSLKSDIRAFKAAKKESDKFRLVGGSFQGEFLVQGDEIDIDEDGEDGLRFTDGQMAFLDFEFQPTKKIRGDFSINILANVAESDFEFRYGDRGLPITVEVKETTAGSPDDTGTIRINRSDSELKSNERVEIYDFQASYEDKDFDLLAFYHTPRFHWGYEGDFFGLMRETTDMEGQDIWNAKAPYGGEFIGKQELKGLKVVAGPEIYWGANPKAMVKYEWGKDTQYAFVMAEDIAQRDDSSSATEATERQSRQATIYAKTNLGDSMTLEVGGIAASGEKHGDEYDRVEGDDIVVDEIDTEDTLGIKAKLAFDVGESRAYVAMNYAGLVADGGDPLREFGTELPYSALGNKKEIEGGIQFRTGNYMIYPRFLYRENIVDANPLIEPVTTGTTLSPGIDPRNRDDDPFAVLDNREASSLELFFTYDPTPATQFYHWNVDMIEDAPFAYNIGITGTRYDTDTDAELFFFEEGGTNASFGEGLEEEDVWLLKSKMIFNPRRGLRTVANFYTGRKQSSGQPGQDPVDFFSMDGKIIVDGKHIYSTYIKVDDFGPYDFQEQFNLVYPLQLKFEYARLLDQLRDEGKSSKVGIKFLYRDLDEDSPDDEYQDGENDYMMEIQTYFKITF